MRSSATGGPRKSNNPPREYHEQERDGFTNVYLDAVEPMADDADEDGGAAVDEVAWRGDGSCSVPPERGRS